MWWFRISIKLAVKAHVFMIATLRGVKFILNVWCKFELCKLQWGENMMVLLGWENCLDSSGIYMTLSAYNHLHNDSLATHTEVHIIYLCLEC